MSFGDSKIGGFSIRYKLEMLKLIFNHMINNTHVVKNVDWG